MRIIRIFTGSWAWQGVEKLNCRTAFFRILGVGSANALTFPVPFSTISTARFSDRHFVITQWKSNHNSVPASATAQQKTIKSPEPPRNKQRGREPKKWGVCRVGLRRVFHRYATGGVFRSPSTHRMPFCQVSSKSHSRISPSTGLSLVVEYITIQYYILEIRRISLLHYTNRTTLYNSSASSEQRVVV